MSAITYVHNKQVLRAYQSLYKKLKSGSVFMHLQNRRFFETQSDKKKRLKKEKKFRMHYARMIEKSVRDN
jgi:ribosomal protein S21